MPRMSIRESFSISPAPDLDKGPRRLENNTFEWFSNNGVRHVRLHLTDILAFYPDGRVKVDTGGWQTVTTKDRLKKYLSDYRIFSDKGLWYVCKLNKGTPERVLFFDGMILPDDFKPDLEKAKVLRKLAREINAFVKKLDALETLPLPSGGDCWECSMFKAEPPIEERNKDYYGCQLRSGKPRSDVFFHLKEHIREGYLHGSLLVNAMRWAGFTDQGIRFHLHGLGSRTTVKSALRRYLRRNLGLPA